MATMTDDAVRGVQGTRASDEEEEDDDGFEKIASSVGARARARGGRWGRRDARDG
jgi:hypothetical protein